MRTKAKSNYIRKIIGITLAMMLVVAAIRYEFGTLYELPNEITLTASELEEFSVGRFGIRLSGEQTCTTGQATTADMTFTVLGGIPARRVTLSIVPERKVYAGGRVVGIALYSEGLIVAGSQEVNTAGGKVNTLAASQIRVGDIIHAIDDVPMADAAAVEKLLDTLEGDMGALKVEFSRDGVPMTCTITYVLDKDTQSRKIGLWVRDSIAGVGTVTYTRMDGRYGALGHPICDQEARIAVPVKTGQIYNCTIVGATKGKRGAPGELKGSFARGSGSIGTIEKNTQFGIFGNMACVESITDELVPIGNRANVKPGKAKIIATVDNQRDYYDIEIIKANTQKNQTDRSMIVNITDKRLIDKVGGIVQGMSGSPIIQNGRLVGAITHVFVGEPTKGYGIYLDWMYNE